MAPQSEPSQPVLPGPVSRPGWPPRDADHLLVTAAQMAALEETLFASGLPVEALMEKAALAVSRRLLAGGPPAGQSPWLERGALVLVGPGHNGGDGLVVARELHLAGVPVRIWSPFERHRPLTDAHLRHARWLGIPVLEGEPDPGDPALWIDALFGIGQVRPPGERLEALVTARQRKRPGALVAVDVPTGLCADRGVLLGEAAARACLTCCIGLLKQGLVQDGALGWVGRLERIDLALPSALLDTLPEDQPLGLGPGTGSAPWPAPESAAGKYARGRLLVVAGSDHYRGAAHLALAGAGASGCGSLRAAVPETIAASLWQVLPHVVATGMGTTGSGDLNLEDLPADALERLDAVLVGPGIGAADSRSAPGGDPAVGGGAGGVDTPAWRRLLGFSGLLVLDADGLNRLAQAATEDGAGPVPWLRARVGPTWITPHAGEFARLFPDLQSLPPLEAAAAAARGSGAVVLLKGARSVVAAPDGRRWQLLRACAGSARAGLGDVLAGYAAARGALALAAMPPPARLDPALLAAAALEHAQAGCRAVADRGPGGAEPLAVARALRRSPGAGPGGTGAAERGSQ